LSTEQKDTRGRAEEFYRQRCADSPPGESDLRRLVELLWQEHSDRVFALAAARLRDGERAADVCQETFVRAAGWLRANAGRRPIRLNFSGWLSAIAGNLVVDVFRENKPSALPTVGDEQWEPVDAAAAGPDAGDAAIEEDLERLRRCLEALSGRDRRVIELADLSGLAHAAIAEQLAAKIGTIGVWLHRARKKLRDCVELRRSA
jgi:RNA polymerase sigma factor (sigma-70 family)